MQACGLSVTYTFVLLLSSIDRPNGCRIESNCCNLALSAYARKAMKKHHRWHSPMSIPVISTLYCDVTFVPNISCTYSCGRLPTCSSSLKPSIEIAELQLRMAKPPTTHPMYCMESCHNTRSQSRTFDCAYVPEYSCVNGVRDVLENQ
jgi:hypothetical protein